MSIEFWLHRQIKKIILLSGYTFLFQYSETSNIDRACDKRSPSVRGVLGNKCAGQHNLKAVQIREIMWK
jgi:hypothetical protein